MPDQKELIEEALEYIHYVPIIKKYKIKGKEAYNQKLIELAESSISGFEEADLNHRHRLTKQTIVDELNRILCEIKHRERTSAECIDIIRVFTELKNERWSNLLGGSYTTYTVVFPLHIRDHGPHMDRFTTSGVEILNISYSEWESDYLNPAVEEDERYLQDILSKIPSDFRFDGYSFWKIDYEASDAAYAFERVRRIIRLFLSKLIYSIHYKKVGKPYPSRRDQIPRQRWSALREPVLYLVFESSDYIDFFDTPIQFTKSEGTHNFPAIAQHFRDLPELSIDRDELNDVEKKIVNALLSYQDGMTESTIQDSFLSFWRGIEILAKYDSPHRDVGPKSLFIYKYVFDKSHIDSKLENFVDEIAVKRGNLVHRRVDLEISERESGYAKILLDALLEFYFTTQNIYTIEEIKTILEYGALDDREKKGLNKFLSVE